jgi:hypothetical protein
MDATTNSLNWFEIPVENMPRAKHFYQVVFSMHMDETEKMNRQMPMFPYQQGDGKVGGALVKNEWQKPSADGAVVYLNANPNMDAVLE